MSTKARKAAKSGILDLRASQKGTVSVGEALEHLLAYSERPVTETPFRSLNEILGGGLHAGQVVVACAGTGMGKTALGLQIASHVASSAPVLFASYELPPHLLVGRMVSQGIPRVQWLDVIRGRVKREEMLAALPGRLFQFSERPSLGSLHREAHALAEEYGQAPLVVIDYMQLVGDSSGDTRQGDPRASNAEASEQIRKLAIELGAPVLVISSVSRTNNARNRKARGYAPGDLVDVAKETGSIEYDAAAVLVLSVVPEKDADGLQLATLTIAKNRFGELAHLDFRFAGASGHWREVGKTQQDRNESIRRQILESVGAADCPLSMSAIIQRAGKKMVKGRRGTILSEIAVLVEEEALEDIDGRYGLAESKS